MMKKILIALFFIVANLFATSQELTAYLPAHQFQEVKLYRYNGFGSQLLDSSKIDSLGNFTLNYTSKEQGMGYLQASDQSVLPVLLEQKGFTLTGTHLLEKDKLVFNANSENGGYYQYQLTHNEREGLLAGWKYLLKQYLASPTYKEGLAVGQVKQNINKIISEDSLQLAKLVKEGFNYASYILPIKNLIQSVANTAKYYPEEIPNKLAQFRKIDYSNRLLYNSGLLNDVLEAHYWLIENSSKPLDSVYIEMNKSTDSLLDSLEKDEKTLNEITDFLFDLLEKHSLFNASEYLALKVLTQNSCTINADLANQLETYRAMKIGNTAKDILFSGLTLKQGVKLPTNLKLNDIKTEYKLVMFGASWCPKCVEELPKAKDLYGKWLKKGVEVVLVSLDHNKEDYLSFVKNLPWTSTCDFLEWETKAAKDYYVFSTPTLFLLDKNNKIVLRPNSISQVDAWVEYRR